MAKNSGPIGQLPMKSPIVSALILSALLVVGCPPDPAAKEPPGQQPTTMRAESPPPTPSDEDAVDSGQYPGRIHIVEPKDTLLHLAERYYGNRNQWRKIWQANKKRLTNPNDLPVGMKLIVP